MKTFLNFARNACSPVAVVILSMAIFTAASQAVSIKMEVKVPGYSSAGWILIVPGSNTGGRVAWSPSRGSYITDRASRGETIRATFRASTPAEKIRDSRYTQMATLNSDRGELRTAFFDLPYAWNFTVPTDPRDDNVYVYIQTVSGEFKQRIPIGGR